MAITARAATGPRVSSARESARARSRSSLERRAFRDEKASPSWSRAVSTALISIGTLRSRTSCFTTATCCASFRPKYARVITGLLRNLGLTAGAVLDASCGIGTQAIGLARAGFSVTATDISRASVERCAREASARGLTMTTGVADLRVLDVDGRGSFERTEARRRKLTVNSQFFERAIP